MMINEYLKNPSSSFSRMLRLETSIVVDQRSPRTLRSIDRSIIRLGWILDLLLPVEEINSINLGKELARRIKNRVLENISFQALGRD